MIIKERGLNKRYMDRYDDKYGGLQLQQKGNEKILKALEPVSLHDMITSFSIIITGILSSGLVLFFENLYYSRKQRIIHKEHLSYGYQN